MDLDDEDFGFTFTNEDEIVQGAIGDRLNQALEMTITFLEKLKGDPKKDTIKWPGDQRVKQIDKFIEQLRRLAK